VIRCVAWSLGPAVHRHRVRGRCEGGGSVRISTLLEEKGSWVATVPTRSTVGEVVERLTRFGIGALVVSDDGRSIDGIVSERDVVVHLASPDGGGLDAPVPVIMSAAVRTCGLSDDTEALMTTMTEHRVRHLPVISEDGLCGIVSIGDVVKCRIAELERDRRELEDYISAR